MLRVVPATTVAVAEQIATSREDGAAHASKHHPVASAVVNMATGRDDRMYDVDFLVARRQTAKKADGFEYAVRWSGYCDKSDTWEDASNIDAALLDEFKGSWKAPWNGCMYAVKVLDTRRIGEKEQARVMWKGYPMWNVSKEHWVSKSELEAPSTPLTRKKQKTTINSNNQQAKSAAATSESAEVARREQSAASEKRKSTTPVAGDSVEVFSMRDGWRLGVVEDTSVKDTLVRFEDGDCVHVLLPLDFETHDVRWPAEHKSQLEGRRVLVPFSVYGQADDEALVGYAGTIKCARGHCIEICFHADSGSETHFRNDSVGKWIIDADDAAATSVWERQVPRLLPKGWPGEIRFCSMTMHEGYRVHQRFLKSMCRLSTLVSGVAIRQVDEDHPLKTSAYNRGLFATKKFKRGHRLGSYAGVIRSAGQASARQQADGAYDIHLDTSKLGCWSRDLVLDAKDIGNECRFINDYRGIATECNVEFRTVADPTVGIWVDVIVKRPIAAGEEILVDYDDAGDRASPQPQHEGPQPTKRGKLHEAVSPEQSCRPPELSPKDLAWGNYDSWLCINCNTKNAKGVLACMGLGTNSLGRPCNSPRSTGLPVMRRGEDGRSRRRAGTV